MKPYYQDDTVTLYCADCRDVLPTLEAGTAHLVVVDPPYYKVKNSWWDQQWDTPTAFLAWLGTITDHIARIMAGNASLYLFASSEMQARIDVMVSERLNVLNNITWSKPSHWGHGSDKEALRAYFPGSEHIIFAEHYGADGYAMAGAGYDQKCDALRGFIFEPLRQYLASEWSRAGLMYSHANEACGTASMAGRHYFSRSQWCLPTAEHYASLQAYANRHSNGCGLQYLRREYEDLRREYEDLRREYEDLRREYEDLRREYEDLRRCFNLTRRHTWEDTWVFEPVQHYKRKHPCEKPMRMLKQIVEVSSRPGDLIIDPFAGKGRTAEVARALGRRCLLIEIEEAWCEDIAHRLMNYNPLPFPEPAPAPVQTRLGL